MFNNKNVMPTYSGLGVDLSADPSAATINPIDIAWALSQQCRFAGHTTQFYSVAEHSVRVSNICSGGERQLIGLLHDATEAYIQDIIRPLRVQLDSAGYLDLELRWAQRIGAHFGLGDKLAYLPEEVMHADIMLLATECRDLINMPDGCYMDLGAQPLETVIRPLSSALACEAFMERLDDLT